jgi:hypothetical protein
MNGRLHALVSDNSRVLRTVSAWDGRGVPRLAGLRTFTNNSAVSARELEVALAAHSSLLPKTVSAWGRWSKPALNLGPFLLGPALSRLLRHKGYRHLFPPPRYHEGGNTRESGNGLREPATVYVVGTIVTDSLKAAGFPT